MADVVTLKLNGLREIGEKMRGLAQDVNLRISRRAVNKAAQIVKKQVIANAPAYPTAHKLEGVVVQPGNLKRNVVVKKIRSPLTAEYIVTVRGKRKDGYAARYARLVEFGTVKLTANPFFRNAWAQTQQKAAVTIKVELEIAIAKASR